MKKVLFGGSFDMIHSGHIEVLNKAKSYGDYLVVMLTSDERIKYKKNPALPIYNENERKNVIGALKMVDEVMVIKGDPKENIAIKGLKIIKPDIYVRTGEVNTDTLFEELSVCQDLNIEMVIVSRLPGSKYRSSARIIKYIIDNFNKKDMDYLIDKDETK